MGSKMMRACEIVDKMAKLSIEEEIPAHVFYSVILEYLSYVATDGDDPKKTLESLHHGLDKCFEKHMKRKGKPT
jgi:hypothetical protein